MTVKIAYDWKDSEVIHFAANELTRYLGRMLPDAPPTILKGKEGEKGAGTDGFIRLDVRGEDEDGKDAYEIRMEGGRGFIAGSNERSVLLGVYRFLHLLGCRFLAPGSRHELVPRLDGAGRLTAACSEKAAYRHRGVCIEGANSIENILDFIDWLPKVGYNCFFLQFRLPYTFLARWYHHELNPLIWPEPFSREDAAACTQRVVDEMHRRGLMLHQGGHGWTGDALGCPADSWKEEAPLPEDRLHLSALTREGRGLFHGVPMNTNLCYSEPEAVDAFVGHVVGYIQDHPGIDYLHVWLADECNNVCECGRCRETVLADQYIDILNRVDARLTELGIPTRIVFLLYQELLWPPKRSTFANPGRFVMMFAPISRTFESSYRIRDAYGPIPEYRRNEITLPTSLDENMAFLRAWQEVFCGDSFVYDYPMGRAHYGDLGYYHIARVIGGDIRKLSRMGLDGYVSCQELRVLMPNSLPNYVMGRMLFDGRAAFEGVAEEYFRAAYGTDWQWALAYVRDISDLCSCDYFNGKGERTDPKVASDMGRLKQLLGSSGGVIGEHVRDGAAAGEAQDLFWKYLDYHRGYALRLVEALRLLAEGEKEDAQACWEEFQRMACERETDFQACLDVYRITEVSSKYTGFELTRRLKETL